MRLSIKYLTFTFILLGIFVQTGCATAPLFKPSKNIRLKYIIEKNITDQKIVQAMEEGIIINGMTMDQVRATWGKPDSIGNKDSKDCKYCYQMYKDGEENWFYRWDILSSANKVVDFKNGIVVDVSHHYK